MDLFFSGSCGGNKHNFKWMQIKIILLDESMTKQFNEWCLEDQRETLPAVWNNKRPALDVFI